MPNIIALKVFTAPRYLLLFHKLWFQVNKYVLLVTGENAVCACRENGMNDERQYFTSFMCKHSTCYDRCWKIKISNNWRVIYPSLAFSSRVRYHLPFSAMLHRIFLFVAGCVSRKETLRLLWTINSTYLFPYKDIFT